MNNSRRKALRDISMLLSKAQDMLSGVSDEEQMCMDNMPENLEDSHMFQKMEDAIDSMDEAADNIEEAIRCIEMASI